MNRQADSRLINNLIEEAAALSIPRIIFAGNGEPFLHRNTLEFIARAKHLGRHTSIFTNGTLLSRETTDELIRAGLDVLRVSILGASSDEYANTHPGVEPDVYNQLKSSLMYLLDRKKALKSVKPQLLLYTTVMAQNCDGLASLASLAGELGAAGVVFLALDDIGDDGIASLALNEAQTGMLQNQVEPIAAQFEEKKIQHNLRAFINVLHRGRLYTEDIYKKIPCYYGWIGSVIMPDGNVCFCCPSRRPIGNLNEQTFTTIWQSYAYERVRKEAITIHKRRRPVPESACHKCVHYAANLRVHRLLRPMTRWSTNQKNLRTWRVEAE